MANLSTLLNRRTPEPAVLNNDYGIVLPHSSALIEDPQGCVVVGETSTYCSAAGCCCLWTVPAGVSQVQFQIWGAGGNGTSCSSSQCCAFWIGGGSGEYTYVQMNTTPGQTFTLCAGGGPATTMSACWTTCNCAGCNSFVCGSNSTCIVSCGGTESGPTQGCSICARQLYPSSDRHTMRSDSVFIQSQCDNCTGIKFGWPTFRCGGISSSLGQYTSANRIIQSAKVPSIVGAIKHCCNGYGYQCYVAPDITCNHSVETVGTGWNGGPCSGCFTNTLATFNRPGQGAPASLFPCNGGGQGASPNWGGRGRSGLVIVKFR